MTNWKHSIQVRDLEADQRLEITCKACGHMHYLARDNICTAPGREYLYLDEVEAETKCKARGCRGKVRLALVRRGDTSAFVGGLA